MKKGLVSIITPCYNADGLIQSLLDSILEQTYKSIEVIIIDDGSTDNSLKTLEKYKKKFDKKKINYQVISKQNGGAASAINLGLKNFSGEFLTFIDADDYLSSKDSIDKRVAFLRKHNDMEAVYTAARVVDIADKNKTVTLLRDDKKPYRSNLFIDMLLENNYVWPPASYLLRTTHFKLVNPDMVITEFSVGQNIQLFLPYWYSAKVGYIDEHLVTIVAHEDSHSRRNNGDKELDRQQGIKEAYLDTLKKISMTKEERRGYELLIDEKYKTLEERTFRDVIDGRDELSRLYSRDEERFRAAHFKDPNTASQDQLTSRLVFSSHSLEKSLSNDGFEIGHGFMVVRLLIGFLNIYRDKNYDKSHLAYINTLSVLKAFYDRHTGTKHTKEIESIFGEWRAVITGTESSIGGAEQISITNKKDNNSKNFKQLAEGRFAIRTYANKPVDKEDIEEAIRIATKTPTVCNRQPVRVRVIYDKEIISKALAIQGGIAHYDTPPVLLLITADDSHYVGINERNQGYIDGGLFAMSVLYALEYKGLAACPLHAMFETERDFRVRGLLGIGDNEKLITFISAGHFMELNNVCKSFRYPVNEIMSEVHRTYEYKIETVEAKPVVPEVIPLAVRIKRKLRIRTRLLKILRRIKSTTRIRTRMRSIPSYIGKALDKIEFAKADGAILTLTGYFNYGNVLQRYALQKFLKNNGLNYVSYADPYSSPQNIYKVGRRVIFKTPLRFLKRIIKNQKPYWYIPRLKDIYPETVNNVNIIHFANKNIWIKPFNPQDKFKSYIVGSDQVWRNWWGNKNILGYYFLDWVNTSDVNRIAYAASFGKDNINEVMSSDDVEYVAPFVRSFNGIAMREESGSRLVMKTWGVNKVNTVIDPTLLLDADDYSALIDRSSSAKDMINPIFTYILSDNPDVDTFLSKVVSTTKQAITSVKAHTSTDDYILPSVEFWLKGFRDADLVITNSFHGMMFSVINNTDFVVIGKESGGVARIIDFLKEYGLEERFIDEGKINDAEITNLKKINWGKVNVRLNKKRKASSKWLLNIINK